jgi:hypothetical protein
MVFKGLTILFFKLETNMNDLSGLLIKKFDFSHNLLLQIVTRY